MLLDTNIFIDYLNGRAEAMAFVTSLTEPPSTSVICAAELMVGARHQREERRILHMLSRIKVLPATLDIALRAGALVRIYQPSHSIGLADAVIAATAEHHGLSLATLNVKHFPMFKRLKRAY